MHHCSDTIGDAYFRTPRNTIKAFAEMLSVLEQNKNIAWNDLVNSVEVSEDWATDMPEIENSPDGLADFNL